MVKESKPCFLNAPGHLDTLVVGYSKGTRDALLCMVVVGIVLGVKCTKLTELGPQQLSK